MLRLEDLIKAFKAGEQEKLPEEYKFLLDPEFQKEIESLGPEDKLKAAAQVLSDQTGKVDEAAVGKLAGAMKQAGLLSGDKAEEGEEAQEEGQEEEAAPGEEQVEGNEERVPVDEEGNPVEEEEQQQQEPGVVAEGAGPMVQPKGTDDPSIPNESLEGKQEGTPQEGAEYGDSGGDLLEDRILRRALAAIKSLLVSD